MQAILFKQLHIFAAQRSPRGGLRGQIPDSSEIIPSLRGIFRFLLLAFAMTGILVSGPLAEAMTCEQALGKKLTRVEKAQIYLKQVKNSKGLRLFLKNENPAKTKKGIVGFFYEYSLRRPTLWLSEKVFSVRKEPAFFFYFPVAMTLGVYLAVSAETAYKDHLVQKAQVEQQSRAGQYAQMIAVDFRYRSIAHLLEKGKINNRQALRQAQDIDFKHHQYFKMYQNINGQWTKENQNMLLGHYLFAHLSPIINQGVQPMPGFIVPNKAQGPLSEIQATKLFKKTAKVHLNYQVLFQRYFPKSVKYEALSAEKIAIAENELFKDVFFTHLEKLHYENKVSRNDLLYRSQEYLFWKYRLELWSAVGVTKLVGETQEPLTLKYVREAILEQIYNPN